MSNVRNSLTTQQFGGGQGYTPPTSETTISYLNHTTCNGLTKFFDANRMPTGLTDFDLAEQTRRIASLRKIFSLLPIFEPKTEEEFEDYIDEFSLLVRQHSVHPTIGIQLLGERTPPWMKRHVLAASATPSDYEATLNNLSLALYPTSNYHPSLFQNLVSPMRQESVTAALSWFEGRMERYLRVHQRRFLYPWITDGMLSYGLLGSMPAHV
jgi:hypothetical protein